MEIGLKLKNTRVKSGFTQEQVAEKLMISRQTVSNWENEKSLPDVVSVMKMSDLYQISLDELLKGDKNMLEKIEKDIAIVKSNRKMIMLGWVTIILALILSITDIMITQSVIDFITSAVPWVLLGVGVAIICAYMNNRKENK